MYIFKDGEMKKNYAVILSLLLVGAWFALVYYKTGIYFESNDERFRVAILSGVMTGEPDAHVIYSNYLLMSVFAFLYRISRSVPWYGIGLIAMLGYAFFLIIKSFMMQCRKIYHILFVGVISAGMLLLFYRILGLIQFTSTAALLAVAAYVCLLLPAGRSRGLLEYAIASLIAYLLRSEAMLMVQPLGLAMLLGCIWIEKERTLISKVRECMRPVVCILAIFFIAQVGSWTGYHGSEWQEFLQYDKVRQELFDYTGKPPYEEVKDILDDHGVSEAEYRGFQDYVVLEWDISTECAKELVAYARTKQTAIGLVDIGQGLRYYLWEQDFHGVNRTAVILLGVTLLVTLISGCYGMIFPVLLLEFGKLFMWIFLIIRGRLPDRVTLPLLACEMVLLITVVIRCGMLERRKTRYRGELALLLFCIVLSPRAYQNGKLEYKEVRQHNAGQEIFIKGLWELEDYCRREASNCYLMDAASMSYYLGSALETESSRSGNSRSTGGWFSNSPNVRRYLQDYLEAAKNGIYLIIYEDGNSIQKSSVYYLTEKTGVSPVAVDHFTASHGGEYTVYHFSNCFPIGEANTN